MGCSPQKQAPKLSWANTPIGQLKVTVVDAFFPAKIYQPSLKLRVTNQYYTSKVPVSDSEFKVNQNYVFFINSFYQGQGRALQLGLFQDDKVKAYGAIDINPLLATPNFKLQARCIMLRQKEVKFGHITVRAHFEQLPYRKVAFRFQKATIRRKTGACGSNKIALRTTIGQEVVQTKYKEDREDTPPIWADQSFKFLVPEGCKKVLLEIVDDRDIQVGQTQLDLEEIFQVRQGNQVLAAQELFHIEDKKQIDAASLKFSYIVGQDSSFSIVQNVLKSSMRGVRPNSRSPSKILQPPGPPGVY